VKNFLRSLGPGLITGASDDDPSGIATYSQVGARFGMGMLWTMLLSYPFMTAIQEISARIGRVTSHGIAGNMRRHYPAWMLYGCVALLFAANTINLGADIGAMAAAAALVAHGPALVWIALFAAISIALEIYLPYTRYVSILKWLTLSLFAYVATAFSVHIDWPAALRQTILPSLKFHASSFTALTAILGTTISPYLFFWQASQEAEEVVDGAQDRALKIAPEQAPAQLQRIRIDTYIGMGISNLVAFFIILTTAATLHAHGITSIDTAEQAAAALKPFAGPFASLLFTLGIVGTGLLAIPVLAGSAAYALGETFRWRVGLEYKPNQARNFYFVLALAIVTGSLLNMLHMNPIKALYWSAVLNGVVSVPVMIVMMRMASNHKVMGRFQLPPYLKAMGWIATALMSLTVLGMFVAR
jgi:NRAMP (natural resistance-associated macrophage protein)-like metal ion transporter